MMRTTEYLAFANKMLLCFGLAFELPVFAFFLAKLGILSSDFLRRKRKIAIVLIFILPPVADSQSGRRISVADGWTDAVLYEASVWIVHFFGSKPFKSVRMRMPTLRHSFDLLSGFQRSPGFRPILQDT